MPHSLQNISRAGQTVYRSKVTWLHWSPNPYTGVLDNFVCLFEKILCIGAYSERWRIDKEASFHLACSPFLQKSRVVKRVPQWRVCFKEAKWSRWCPHQIVDKIILAINSTFTDKTNRLTLKYPESWMWGLFLLCGLGNTLESLSLICPWRCWYTTWAFVAIMHSILWLI